MATDPNWLLSTTSQSTAALVAIAGGFIMSRVIAIAGERSGLEQRHAELTDRKHLVGAEYDRLEDRVLAEDLDDLFDELVRALLDNPTATPDELVTQTQFHRRTAAEITPFIEQVRARVGPAKARIEALLELKPTTPRPQSFEEALEHLPPLDDVDRRLHSFLFDELRGDPYGLSHLALTGIRDSNWAIEEARRYNENVRDRDLAMQERLRIERELELVDTALARVETPAGLSHGLWVFVYFAVVGIVLPVAVMAWQPASLPRWASIVLALLFFSGLAVFLRYLVQSVRTLASAT